MSDDPPKRRWDPKRKEWTQTVHAPYEHEVVDDKGRRTLGKYAARLKREKRHYLKELEKGKTFEEAATGIGRTVVTVSNWRKRDDEFDVECLRRRGKLKTGRQVVHMPDIGTVADGDEGWARAFLRIYSETGSREEALAQLGLSASAVRKELDGNAEFALAMKEVQQRRLWRIEDSLLQRAEEGSSADAKWALKELGLAEGRVEGAEAVEADPFDSDFQEGTWLTGEGMESAEEWLDGRDPVKGDPQPAPERTMVTPTDVQGPPVPESPHATSPPVAGGENGQ